MKLIIKILDMEEFKDKVSLVFKKKDEISELKKNIDLLERFINGEFSYYDIQEMAKEKWLPFIKSCGIEYETYSIPEAEEILKEYRKKLEDLYSSFIIETDIEIDIE